MTRFASSAAAGLLLLCASPLVGQNGGPLGSPIPGTPLGEAVAEDRGPRAFLPYQLEFPRVAGARDATDEQLRDLFQEQGLPYPAQELFLRVFKHEREMELWARAGGEGEFTLVKTYDVCSLPGQLGPKRKMGDIQVPEGFYFIDHFNPRSEFHLSLRVDYPNMADRMRRQDLALGGDIFIHGGCATVGCVPIRDHNMEELYWLAVQATDAGQRLIPVHIFPARLHERNLRWLRSAFDPEPALMEFWESLGEGYEYFERTRQVPWITVAQNGSYAVPDLPELAGDTLPADSIADDGPRPATDSDAAGGESTGPVGTRARDGNSGASGTGQGGPSGGDPSGGGPSGGDPRP